MKTKVCLFAAIAAMTATMTSYAATYETTNKVSTAEADGMQTVMIYKGDETATPSSRNIVCVDQATNTFDAQTKFLLKSSAANDEGLYTVLLGGKELKKETFYIGMSEAAGDKPMALITGENGYKDNGNSTYNFGYTATLSSSDKKYNSLIIKTNDGRYMGCANPLNSVTVTGDTTVTIGIQINGVSGEVVNGVLTPKIAGVWLSPRVISNDGTVTSSQQSQTAE